MVKQYRHGDLLLEKISEIPEGTTKAGTDVILEGEATGHAHRLATKERTKTYLAADDAGRLFVHVEGEASVTHEEHSTIILPAGDYAVSRQREYDPYEEAARNVAD